MRSEIDDYSLCVASHAFTFIFNTANCIEYKKVCYIKIFVRKYFFIFSAAPCWLKALDICDEGSWIRALISSVRLDVRKDNQSVKLTSSVCIQNLNSASCPLPKGIVSDTKRKRTFKTPVFWWHRQWQLMPTVKWAL